MFELSELSSFDDNLREKLLGDGKIRTCDSIGSHSLYEVSNISLVYMFGWCVVEMSKEKMSKERKNRVKMSKEKCRKGKMSKGKTSKGKNVEREKYRKKE